MANTLTQSPEVLRLGIDLDGVVADFNRGWIARCNRERGTTLDPEHVVGWDGLHHLAGFASMDGFWAWARHDAATGRSVFRDLPPMPDAVPSLERLARRHRIVILTSRFDWAIPDTLHWIARHQIPAREVHFVERKQDVPCDVYLDDAPHQLAALVAGRPDALVCRAVRSWNQPVPGASDVTSWVDFERLVAGS